ncbi:FkbM family methyltransferase [Salsipaludibacter albus]|uniref:FkbM family methyltransferase n=1 Tax=Salsipaludibacter albus TaxID=2849650 RepID=UPI001EE43BBC|nr:FkbM family methyltransferase [Salsipaludibacter albus]MBY5164492.1 FkbM family methyltransferase [Salsipaludibacter albus]
MRLLRFLEPEVERLPEWVTPGGVSLDVGANYGPYTYALANLSAQVHAFEPNPECARVLRAWHRGNVRVHQLALSDVTGVARLQVPMVDGTARSTQGNIRPDGEGVEVETRRLDDFAFERVDFVKVDVEGHELALVAGAADTLVRHRPVVLMEIAAKLLTGDVDVHTVVDAVEALGYRGTLLAPSGDVPAADFSIARHQPLVDGDRGEGYANMFVFHPFE